MDKKAYICMECGMTHFVKRKPKKCRYCGIKFDIEKEIKFLQCGKK